MDFIEWIHKNMALLEYFYEEVCPTQWLSLKSVKKISQRKMENIQNFFTDYQQRTFRIQQSASSILSYHEHNLTGQNTSEAVMKIFYLKIK